MHFQSSESIFEVKYQLNLPENYFLLRICTELEEQLSLKTFLISVIFEKFYLVNLGPIFVGLFPILNESWEKNKYTGLISDCPSVECATFYSNPKSHLTIMDWLK